jgi:hypothetical protein
VEKTETMTNRLRSQGRDNDGMIPPRVSAISSPFSEVVPAALISHAGSLGPVVPEIKTQEKALMMTVSYPSGWYEAPNTDTCECGTLAEDCFTMHVTGCSWQNKYCSDDCAGCQEIIENDLEEAAMEEARGL